MDGRILQFCSALFIVVLGIKGFQESALVWMQPFRFWFDDLQFQGIAFDDFGSALLDHAEQDHGHDLIKWLLHEDGGFDSREAAFDAVAFDLDLGWQVFHLSALSIDDTQDRHSQEHEGEESTAAEADDIVKADAGTREIVNRLGLDNGIRHIGSRERRSEGVA